MRSARVRPSPCPDAAGREQSKSLLRRLSAREKLIALSVVLIVAGGTGLFGLRRFESLITFHPITYSPASPWALPRRAEDVWFVTSDKVTLHGWFIASTVKPAPATVIYFHGNGGNISHIAWVGENLSSRGYDVLVFDYRGYGRSEGAVDSEVELYRDGEAAYDYVVKERGVKPERLVLYGQSLGTAVVADVASREPCAAVILESGLSSAADMAAVVLPQFPRSVYALGRNRFESARKLSQVRAPVLITHGDPDPVIPVGQGRALYQAANEPKRLRLFPGAGHNVHGIVGEQYLNFIADFIKESVSR